MDDKKFKQELSKIAKWYIPVITDTTQKVIKPRTTSEINPSLGPVIEELKPCLKPCGSCGTICEQRCNHTLKYNRKQTERFWEHSCQTCKKPLDSETMKVKEKPKSDYMRAKEAAEQGLGAKRAYWWNDSIVDGKNKSS